MLLTIRKIAGTLLRAVLAVIAALVLAAGTYLTGNVNFGQWTARQAAAADFTERHATVDGTRLNYAEGPDNGPPLVLVHGQLTSWQHWNRVLPRLAENYHVYAVDCHGHGGSDRTPERYDAVSMSADLEGFIAEVVGEPATVAGHSSGGLVAAHLAANAPERVRAVFLEDPPFFSSVLPRARKTVNWVDLSTVAHDYLQRKRRSDRDDEPAEGPDDFTAFYLRHTTSWELFEEAGKPLRRAMLTAYERNPDRPASLPYMPPVWNETFAALGSYDPRFGEAFHDGSFHEGFDHAATLARIEVPTVLVHTNWQYDDNGILLGAMNGDDAARARSLLPNAEFVKVDSGHGFHLEQPARFVRIMADLEART